MGPTSFVLYKKHRQYLAFALVLSVESAVQKMFADLRLARIVLYDMLDEDVLQESVRVGAHVRQTSDVSWLLLRSSGQNAGQQAFGM